MNSLNLKTRALQQFLKRFGKVNAFLFKAISTDMLFTGRKKKLINRGNRELIREKIDSPLSSKLTNPL